MLFYCMKNRYFLLVFVLIFNGLTGFSQGISEIPAAPDKGSWTMVLLPDPQGYTKFKRNQPLLDILFNWIETNKERLNIRLVLCTGDLVEQNFVPEPDVRNGDQTSYEQWQVISAAFKRLDNKLPYVLCTGNHDYGTNHTENRYSQFNSFFPPDRNPLNKTMLVGMAPNAQGVETLENACYEFVAPSGRKMLIFSLEYFPRKSVISWATRVALQPRYRYHTGVILTHSYMHSSTRGNRLTDENDGLPGFSDITTGRRLWENFISSVPNIRMVFCGHVVDEPTHQGHTGFREDKNAYGTPVQQMLFNAQNEGGNWQGNGGNTWIRLLEFSPGNELVNVHTVSPLFAVSPETIHLAQRKEPFDQFSFKVAAYARDTVVLSGKVLPFTLSGYKIPVSVKGSFIAQINHPKSPAASRIVSDTSGLFVIEGGNQLKLKARTALSKRSANEFEISLKSGSDTASFILVKDQFIRNKVVAHRGAWKDAGVPQNSLKSEELAIKYGCEASEFDVWLSADGVPVVSHDGIIGGRKIEETSAEELQQVPLGANCYVPTLEEYLLSIRGQNKTRLFLEIKTSEKGQERCLELTRKVVAMVQRMKVQAWVDYISFNYGVLQEIMKLDPSANTAYLWGDRTPATVKSDGLSGLDYPYEHYRKNPSWMEEARQRQLSINSWTINQENRMVELLDQHVDLITTDEPLMLLRLLERRAEATVKKDIKRIKE